MNLPLTPALGAIMVVLALAGAAVAWTGRLGFGRDVLVACARAAVQLAAVSLVIVWVVRSWSWVALFLLVMYGVAAGTAGRRVTAGRGAAWAALPLAAGAGPVLGLLVGTGVVPAGGITVIPVAGILLGGCMTATALAGRRALDELEQRRGEVEAALSIGFTDREAALEICRPAAARALVPALDQTRTVGLVTLPGAFVGMLLGGADPVQAGAVQLLVLIALLAAEAAAVLVTIELAARGRFRRPGAGSDSPGTAAAAPRRPRRLPRPWRR
ncbi:ABC transporter permease [Bailinhaonella thermotolerans]|uniref:ABC transporter permease n=1 Tax=Bailinhaonella thermotolerans TaxID=1070861 RepID=A0A3A4BS40_9ACTN|nr:ABC transporter permease [Bailinhaonella thermotolerans]RJL34136.1 ABC transporter permease [Bailinhaonella thermotolerans]